MRHAFLTCLWRREALAREVLANTMLAAPPGSEFVAVCSRDEDALVAREAGWRVVHAENSPLSRKWQAGLTSFLRAAGGGLREDVPDSVTILGSDDLLSARAVDRLLSAMEAGAPFAGLSGCYVWRPADERFVHWPGYRGVRAGEPIGTGRTFSRALLDELEWKLWPEKADRSLDSQAWARLRGREGAVLFSAEEAPVLDVKTDEDVDMGTFESMSDGSEPAGPEALAWFEEATLALVRRLADPVRATPFLEQAAEPRLAAALVVKNEAAQLPRCLRSLAGVVDELVVVVDPSSSDRTREIAAASGGLVLERPWTGFADQRNYGLAHVRARWRLVIDADEQLVDGAAVRAAAYREDLPEAVNGLVLSVASVTGNGAARLHRDAVRVVGPGVAYRWRRHNELVGVRELARVRGATIRTTYHGRLRGKAAGALRDLLAEWEEEGQPQHAAAYLATTYRGVGEFEKAIEWANRSLALDPMNQYGVQSWLDLAHSTQAARGFEEGDEVLRRATNLHPGCADLWHSWLATVAYRWAQAAANPGPYRWLPQVSTPALALMLPALVEMLRLPLGQAAAEAPAEAEPAPG